MISKSPVREISAEEFAERCLEWIDEVTATGEELVIRQNAGRVVVRPLSDEDLRDMAGRMLVAVGDVISPVADWSDGDP
jgi:hypothetical protein